MGRLSVALVYKQKQAEAVMSRSAGAIRVVSDQQIDFIVKGIKFHGYSRVARVSK